MDVSKKNNTVTSEDPDINAALEELGEFEELEDDFVLRANASYDTSADEADVASPTNIRGTDLGAYTTTPMLYRYLLDKTFLHAEIADDDLTLLTSCDNNLCVTSDPSKPMRKLDEMFENILEDYEDEEIGSMALRETEGTCEPVAFLRNRNILDVENKRKQACGFTADDMKSTSRNFSWNVPCCFEKRDVVSKKLSFDCESIFSDATGSSHGPSVIKLVKNKVNCKNRTVYENLSDITDASKLDSKTVSIALEEVKFRPKNETAEQKKLRKAIIKEAQRVSRLRKKETKIAYRNEALRTAQEIANIRSTVATLKLQ